MNYVFLAFLHYFVVVVVVLFKLINVLFCFVYASRSRLKHFVRARSGYSR